MGKSEDGAKKPKKPSTPFILVAKKKKEKTVRNNVHISKGGRTMVAATRSCSVELMLVGFVGKIPLDKAHEQSYARKNCNRTSLNRGTEAICPGAAWGK